MQFRTETEILLELITDAQNKGLLDDSIDWSTVISDGTHTENQFVLLLSCIAMIGATVESQEKMNYENSNILTATGEALDAYGELFKIPRKTSKPARLPFSVSIDTAESTDITIPAGTLLIIDPILTSDTYITEDNITINAGVTSSSGIATCTTYGITDTIPQSSTIRLSGFENIKVENEELINGSEIEEDDDYRLRLQRWTEAYNIGTTQCISNYLDNLSNVNEYKLIPRYNGIGTLKIICDAPRSELENISDSVYEKVMLATDYPPIVERPENCSIGSITVGVTIEEINMSSTEIQDLIVQQVRSFISGGYTRTGLRIAGLRIGEDYVPSQLGKYLFSQIPEAINIKLGSYTVVSVDDNQKAQLDSVVVEWL